MAIKHEILIHLLVIIQGLLPVMFDDFFPANRTKLRAYVDRILDNDKIPMVEIIILMNERRSSMM